MTIGTAATYVEALPGVDPQVADVKDKLARIAENRRAKWTVDNLLSLINHEHIETVGTLQWLQTLVSYVPQLKEYRPMVCLLYKTRAVCHRLPRRPSAIHPLGTSN